MLLAQVTPALAKRFLPMALLLPPSSQLIHVHQCLQYSVENIVSSLRTGTPM